MRPVDKGIASQKEYMQYKDAEPDLEERIGAYCFFVRCLLIMCLKSNTRKQRHVVEMNWRCSIMKQESSQYKMN